MQEVFEKIIEKLEEEKNDLTDWYEDVAFGLGIKRSIEIVTQEAAECKHGHFGCNSNGKHEKCSSCCDYDCKNRNSEWFGVKDDNNGWIPCSERLPDEYGDYLVAWKPLHMSAEDIIRKVGRAIPHYYEIVEYDPDDEELWIGSIEQAQGEYEIIAWQPLPDPYRPTRESCSNRHENGNCLAVGGFCTSVDDKYCKYHKKKTNFDMCCESVEAMAQIIDIAKIGWTKEQIMEWLQKEECEVPE